MCVSVTQHLTSRTFVRLTISTTYSTGSEGQNFCVVFSENARVAELKCFHHCTAMRWSAIFTQRHTHMRITIHAHGQYTHGVLGYFVNAVVFRKNAQLKSKISQP